MRRELSIAIVGGGPAGATASRMLAERGARVTLFEADDAQEKPCGGGITAQALKEFNDLADPRLPRRVVHRITIYSPSNREATLEVPVGLHMFRRHDLDSFLRARAVDSGALLRLDRVRGVRRAGSCWELRTDSGDHGPFDRLVGADGVRGIVRRTVAGAYEEGDLSLALYRYVPGVARPEVVLKFFEDLDGYLWAFPRTDHVSVGICASWPGTQAARLEDELGRFVEAHYPEGRGEDARLKGYFIPSSRRPEVGGRTPAGPGWALVGDAGGFVDPLTREGISHAMRSAARAALTFAARSELTTPALPPDLGWAHRHAGGFYRASFLENLTRLAAASSSIRRVLADLFSGHQPYVSLKRRLLMNALPCGLEVTRSLLRGGMPG